ncbi:IS4 family transposase [Streptomyces bottropensis ATCC 25435]|uniref:IS4 family transposase n=1 Tax=Streptomyces bottropensis ATCC 25435 TaxID=1054862 RepID=M3DJH8_9ACTN|nr:IS4 family transposase [Streptomyces bottropensis ATCC 25435]
MGGRSGPPTQDGALEEIRHREKWRLALDVLDVLDVLDELASRGLVPPVVVDADYGQNADFRDGLERRGIGYVVAIRSDVTVHPHDAVPTAPPWSGNGRKPQPRYRDKPSPVAALVARQGRQAFTEVTWR